MLERILFSGSGGQGVLLAGKLLATAAMKIIPHVTLFPSYGAEVRGGTSNCEVVLSSDEISSPVCEKFDSMILMSRGGAQRFLTPSIRDCLVLLNVSLCEPPEVPPVVAIRATEWASDLGDTRIANFVMLGAYLSRKPVIPPEDMEACIRSFFTAKAEEALDLNLAGFKAGLTRSP